MPYSLQQVQDLGLLDPWGALNCTLIVRGVWPQLFLLGPRQETNVATIHTCTAELQLFL